MTTVRPRESSDAAGNAPQRTLPARAVLVALDIRPSVVAGARGRVMSVGRPRPG